MSYLLFLRNLMHHSEKALSTEEVEVAPPKAHEVRIKEIKSFLCSCHSVDNVNTA
uniref:Uncharacterized protein n=1 Tax=Sinocyclocheilus anshuiensis TaxID=1608454 RepID=A0A671KV53_9TELE